MRVVESGLAGQCGDDRVGVTEPGEASFCAFGQCGEKFRTVAEGLSGVGRAPVDVEFALGLAGDVGVGVCHAGAEGVERFKPCQVDGALAAHVDGGRDQEHPKPLSRDRRVNCSSLPRTPTSVD